MSNDNPDYLVRPDGSEAVYAWDWVLRKNFTGFTDMRTRGKTVVVPRYAIFEENGMQRLFSQVARHRSVTAETHF